jgi:hypothetical protein
MEERLIRIESMGKRIAGFVEYMCSVRDVTTTSNEAKEKAVLAFYDKLLLVERQLNHRAGLRSCLLEQWSASPSRSYVPISFPEVIPDLDHEGGHLRAPMVSCYMRV